MMMINWLIYGLMGLNISIIILIGGLEHGYLMEDLMVIASSAEFESAETPVV